MSAALLAPIAHLALGGNQFTQAQKKEGGGELGAPGSDADDEEREAAEAAAKVSGSTTIAQREEAFVNKARDKLLDKADAAAAAADGASTDVVVETDGLLWLLLGVWRAEAERRAVALRRAASGFSHAVSAKLMTESDFNNVVGAAAPGMRAALRRRLFNEVKRTCFEPAAAPKQARTAKADPREHLEALHGAQCAPSGVVLDEERFAATLSPWLMDGFKVLAPETPPKRGVAAAAGAPPKALSLRATGSASTPSAQLQLLASVWGPVSRGMEREVDALREVRCCPLARPPARSIACPPDRRADPPPHAPPPPPHDCSPRQRLYTIENQQEFEQAASKAAAALESGGAEGGAEAGEPAPAAGSSLTEGLLDAVSSKREAMVAAMTDMPLVPSAKDAKKIEGAFENFVSLYHEICRLKTLAGVPGRISDKWDGADDSKKKKKKKRKKM